MLELRLHSHISAEALHYVCTLHRTGDRGHVDDLKFFLEISSAQSLATLDIIDGFVFGSLFYAMRAGQKLRAHGALSQSAVFNLHELQGAWVNWRPERYRQIDIEPDLIVEKRPVPHKDARAIAAYSGGVDGAFTALRHRLGLLGPATYPVTDVVMVHGFDVPLDRQDAFAQLVHRVRPTLDEFALKLNVVRTNIRQSLAQDWEDSHAAQLALCLHAFSTRFRYGLIGSTDPYNHLAIPWGSNPITDPLLSGDLFRVVPDGTAYGRTAKVALLNQHPTARRGLKVCWEGDDPAANCGRCEKCMRTKLNFLAVGNDSPECFDEPMEVTRISAIPLRNRTQFLELVGIMEYACEHGVSGEWVRALEQRVAAHRGGPGLPQRAWQKIRRMSAWAR